MRSLIFAVIYALGFIAAYLLGGRKVGVPLAVAVIGSPWIVTIIICMLDFAQIPLFYYLYEKSRKVRLFNIKINAKDNREIIKKYRIWRIIRRFGTGGIFILSALPSFGGGIWSSVLLAYMLKTEKKVAYLLIITGTIAGIIFLAFFSQGLIILLKSFFP